MTVSVQLPPAVRRQAEEADRKIADVSKAQSSPGASQEAEAQQQQVQQPDPSQQAVEQVVQQPPAQPAAADDELRRVNARYATLEGKYNAELPRLQAENRNLAEMVSQLRSDIEALKTPAAPAPGPITDQDRELVGDEILDIQRRTAQHEALSSEQRIERKFGQTIDQLKAQLQEVKNATLLREMTAEMPNWRDINATSEWLIWLGQPDPLSGITRQLMLDKAMEVGDAKRVILFFRNFLDESKQFAGRQAAAVVSPTSLEAQVQPDARRGGAGPAKREKVWKASEIKQVTTDILRNRYKDRPAEAQRLMAEMNKAVAENRVTLD